MPPWASHPAPPTPFLPPLATPSGKGKIGNPDPLRSWQVSCESGQRWGRSKPCPPQSAPPRLPLAKWTPRHRPWTAAGDTKKGPPPFPCPGCPWRTSTISPSPPPIAEKCGPQRIELPLPPGCPPAPALEPHRGVPKRSGTPPPTTSPLRLTPPPPARPPPPRPRDPQQRFSRPNGDTLQWRACSLLTPAGCTAGRAGWAYPTEGPTWGCFQMS